MHDGADAVRVLRKGLETSEALLWSVLQATPTNAEVCLVDKPKSDSIFVALEQVQRCYAEQGDTTWTGHKKHRKKSCLKGTTQPTDGEALQPHQGPVTRSRSRLQAKK